jgi:hypothetical protein
MRHLVSSTVLPVTGLMAAQEIERISTIFPTTFSPKNVLVIPARDACYTAI